MQNITSNKVKFLEICEKEIHREGIGELVTWLVKSDFFVAPASTRFHGNVEGGLCQHSLNVYENLIKDSHVYEEKTPPETLAIAALFHDICKANFYKLGTRNVKNDATGQWEKKAVYEIDDQFPMGHGEKSVIMLQNFIKLTKDEMLAIRWHMGSFDNAVKGGEWAMSKAYDECKLAVALHIADMAATYFDEEATN